MNDRLRRGAVLAALTAACLPLYQSAERLPALEPLARAFAVAAAGVLELVGADVARDGLVLRPASGFAVEVGANCTAWIHIVLFVSGLALLHPGWRSGLRYAAAGVLALGSINLLRLVLVVLAGAWSPRAFEWMHRAVGETLLVVSLLLLWRFAPAHVESAVADRVPA